LLSSLFLFFFYYTATTEIYTLSLHDALPILKLGDLLLTIVGTIGRTAIFSWPEPVAFQRSVAVLRFRDNQNVCYFYYLIRSKYLDRKSTRLNSSHRTISYAVFCLKKKKKKIV